MTINLNSFYGKLLISVSFSYFSEVLFYSFIWRVFCCLLILPNSLFLRIKCISIKYIRYISLPVLKKPPYVEKMSHGAQWQNPSWSPEAGTAGVPTVWAACLFLWLSCDCCRHVSGWNFSPGWLGALLCCNFWIHPGKWGWPLAQLDERYSSECCQCSDVQTCPPE